MSLVLSKLLEEIASGRLRIVDLTQPLSPQTPLLPLPPHSSTTRGRVHRSATAPRF